MLISPYVLSALERDFYIYGVIGHGAYGVVLSARGKASARPHALKVILPTDAHQTPRLMPSNAVRELSVLGGERHPNIVEAQGVTVFDNGVVVMCMTLYDGTLRKLMDSHGQYYMTLADTRFVFAEIVKGCAAAYASKGVIHRDLKPENVLIGENGRRVSVADWGVCRCGADAVTCVDVPYSAEVITTWYAPPEALAGRGHYDAAVDVWSLGVILGEMLAGRPLFRPARCARRDFIAASIFPVMGTPVADTDTEFFRTACDIKTTGSPHQPNRLATKLRPDAPADVVALLQRMLSYDPKRRPTLSELLRHPYVCDAPSASVGLALAAEMVQHPEPVAVAASSGVSPMYVHVPFATTGRDDDAMVQSWNTRVFPTPMLLRTWEQFQSSGTLVECGYVWLACMRMSTRMAEDADIPVQHILVGMLTLVAATTCLFNNRCNTLFVQNITPGLQQKELFAAELHVLVNCGGNIVAAPAWFQDIKANEAEIAAACTRACV